MFVSCMYEGCSFKRKLIGTICRRGRMKGVWRSMSSCRYNREVRKDAQVLCRYGSRVMVMFRQAMLRCF
jgi:hypothetical protein